MTPAPLGRIVHGDNLPILRSLPDAAVDLVYTDPPFNTGGSRAHTAISVVADEAGDRAGFGGRRYRTTERSTLAWADRFDDYLEFLEPRLREIQRVLAPTGALYLHLDAREVHYVKVLLDEIFGRDRFLNEIIWAYDFGGRPKRRWPAKHDNILVYVCDPQRYTFNTDEIDRIPYMAPGLVGPRRRRAASCPPMSGGTRSSAPTPTSAPATRPRNPKRWLSGSCAPPAIPATWCSTRSRAAAPWAPSPSASGAATC